MQFIVILRSFYSISRYRSIYKIPKSIAKEEEERCVRNKREFNVCERKAYERARSFQKEERDCYDAIDRRKLHQTRRSDEII